MRAMISGQRELQEGARWLARRGVAAWASQRRFDPPLPKGPTGWRAGNEAWCGRPGGMSPELCACAGLLAVFRSLTSEAGPQARAGYFQRSEEHTSELQSRLHLVCRLLLEKKKKTDLYHLIQ